MSAGPCVVCGSADCRAFPDVDVHERYPFMRSPRKDNDPMLKTRTLFVVQEHVWSEEDSSGGRRLLAAKGDTITEEKAVALGLLPTAAAAVELEPAADAPEVLPSGAEVAYALAVCTGDIDPTVTPRHAFTTTWAETLERVVRLNTRASEAEAELLAAQAQEAQAQEAPVKEPTKEPTPTNLPPHKDTKTRHKTGPDEVR